MAKILFVMATAGHWGQGDHFAVRRCVAGAGSGQVAVRGHIVTGGSGRRFSGLRVDRSR
jgi:hypothetical protein